jgi:threo-3-hydroxy-L-aspartate ammonia-lyase
VGCVDTWLTEQRAHIEAAAVRIAGHARRTPVLVSELEGGVVIKPELLQRTGSFKVRGAFNALLQMRADRPEVRGVLAVSSGNHAQAVALAAAELGLEATVVMSADSQPLKVAATRALGARIISDGITMANREERARQLAEDLGIPMVHAFDDWDVVHGQGTATLELLGDHPGIRLVVAPVGGGGLISGTALAAASSSPRVRVIGVEPEVAADAAQSLRAGRVVALDAPPATIADGVRSLHIGDIAADVIIGRGLVEDITTVSEGAIEHAIAVAAQQLHLVVEPSGALPLAALLDGKLPRRAGDGPPALLLTGGNVDPQLLSRVIAAG